MKSVCGSFIETGRVRLGYDRVHGKARYKGPNIIAALLKLSFCNKITTY